MATYVVTPVNWQTVSFWTSISESGSGHTLDFSGLGASFDVDIQSGSVTLTDGVDTFVVGDAGYSGTPDASLGGTTYFSYFTALVGGDGNDTLSGDTGNDTIDGGAEADAISGGSGNDSLSGGSGDDVFILEDGYGNDTIDGGSTGETIGDTLDLSGIVSDLTVDLSSGTSGTGTVTGVDGTVTFTDIERVILGGANDTVVLASGSGNDVVVGFKSPSDNGDGTFTGNDLLDLSGLGAVTTDDIVVTDTNGDGTGDTILTFPGGETLTLEGVPPALVGSPGQLKAMGVTAGTNDYLVEGTSGDDTIDLSYAGDPEGDKVDASDNASGTDSDMIAAGDGDDSILAVDGNDTIYGGDGADTIRAGDGMDLLVGGTGNDSLNGGADEDTFRFEDGFGTDEADGGETTATGEDDDTVDLSALTTAAIGSLSGDEQGAITAGTDTLYFDEMERIILTGQDDQFDTGSSTVGFAVSGGDGDDTILAVGGDDALSGGSGSDLFSYSANFGGNDTITGGEDGTDVDHIDLSGLTVGVQVDFNGNAYGDIDDSSNLTRFSEIEQLTLTDQADTVDASADTLGIILDSADGDDSVLGGDGTDSIAGGAGSDSLAGGDDNDTLRGGTEGDLLLGGAGDDSLYGDEGDDTVYGGSGADSLESGTGNDYYEGGNGDDWVNGDYGNDTLYGGSGDDFVRGSYDNDILYGGTGDDYVWGGWGDDTIVLEDDFGNDTISAEDMDQTLGDTLDLSAITTDLTIDLTDVNPEIGTVSDGTSTATFEEIEIISLSSAEDTIILADGSGNDIVSNFEAPTDNGDGTYSGNDLLDVTGVTSDGSTPVFAADVVVTDSVGDGSGDAILTFPGGESIRLVGVLSSAVSSPAQLAAMGIPIQTPDFIVEGGSGDDSIGATYTGDPDGDLIDNSDHSDGGDADSVTAGDGNDTIDSGAGRDTVYGDAGDDVITGGAGDDTMYGESGDDTFVLTGNHGSDRITGGETGETNGDTIDATGINQTQWLSLSTPESGSIVRGAQATVFSEIESIQLGSGDDVIAGSTGNDSVSTGTGADSVDGGAGDDVFDIGAADGAADEVLLEDGDGSDTIVGFEAPTDLGGGSYGGNDLLNVSNLTVGNGVTSVTVSHVTVTDTVGDGTGDAILNFVGGETLTLVGVLPSQVSSDAQLQAMGIPAATGDDIVEGTSGDDLIDNTYADDPDGDLIDSGDNLAGTDDDVVQAGDGDDTIEGRTGDDSLLGEGGDDVFVLDTSPGDDTLVGGETGETTGDVLDATLSASNLTLSLTSAEAGTLQDGSETVTFSEIEQFRLGTQSDTLLGSSGNDSVSGGGAGDSLSGGAGDDSLAGDGGNDFIDGGTGADSLTGGVGADTLTGGTGDDTLSLGTADVAADVVVLADGDGNDQIIGFEVPTDFGDGTWVGNDQLDVSGLTTDGSTGITVSNVTVSDTVGDGSGDAVLTFPSGDSITLIGVSVTAVSSAGQLAAMGIPTATLNQLVNGTSGDDSIDGSFTGDPEGDMVDANDNLAGTNDDVIGGGAGNDTIDGGAGNDNVAGGTGNDDLSGGTGNDTLGGADGADTLNSDAGDDYLSGGADNDTFVLTDGMGADTIDGGETVTTGSDLDIIDATGLTGAVSVTFTSTEAGTLTDGTDTISFTGIEEILSDTQNDTIDASNSGGDTSLVAGDGDDTVLGGVGGDTMEGGDGNDSLFGGAGDDSLVGGDGNDSLLGGTGSDTLDGGAGNDVFGFLSSGDSASGGDGDDTFTVRMSDMAGGSSTIDGGETGEVLGDVLNIFGEATISMSSAEDGVVNWVDGSSLTFSNIESVTYAACFTSGTMIKALGGDIPVEMIAPGQRILTRDNGFKPVEWAGGRHYSAAELQDQPHLAPIRIRAGALGPNNPAADLMVSPQHRMLIAQEACAILFEAAEVLVAAKDLLHLDGVDRIVPEDGAEYFHILFDRHEIIMGNGAWSESFQPGDLSLSGLDIAQRREIFDIFPELLTASGDDVFEPARLALREHQAAVLRT